MSRPLSAPSLPETPGGASVEASATVRMHLPPWFAAGDGGDGGSPPETVSVANEQKRFDGM